MARAEPSIDDRSRPSGGMLVTEPIVPHPGGHPASTSASLLERARARDEAAWERIVDLYAPLVYRWCRRRGLDESDTLDVGQEVFQSVYAKLETFRRTGPEQSFRAWLKAIAENKVLVLFRRRSRQPAAPGGSDAREMLADWTLDPRGRDDEEEEEERSERKLVLHRCLDAVRAEFEPRTWEAFWRVVVEEIPAADVARALGISRNAVYLAKSRVLGRLSELFDQIVEDLGGSR
jgi:RNA polymerase sigma-70 factor (ECF subfamily)